MNPPKITADDVLMQLTKSCQDSVEKKYRDRLRGYTQEIAQLRKALAREQKKKDPHAPMARKLGAQAVALRKREAALARAETSVGDYARALEKLKKVSLYDLVKKEKTVRHYWQDASGDTVLRRLGRKK